MPSSRLNRTVGERMQRAQPTAAVAESGASTEPVATAAGVTEPIAIAESADVSDLVNSKVAILFKEYWQVGRRRPSSV